MYNSACQALKSGEVIIFPTETVYGIGANARDYFACQKIYQIKSRPQNNPLIVHVSTLEKALEIGEFSGQALILAKNFWPGPVTLVVPLKSGSNIAANVTAGLDTIAIRIPKHEIALQIIADMAIAAPSANPSGYISPTSYEHVFEHFKDLTIIDGGNSVIGIESTIIDCNNLKILRQGFITSESIEKILNSKIKCLEEGELIRAPGMLAKHYSPKAKVRLNAINLEDNEVGLGFGKTDLGEYNLSRQGDLIEAAAGLYAALRALDKKTSNIAIAPIPEQGIGIAINDRLRRAAS